MNKANNTASIVLSTEAEPFTAHAQGISFLFMLLIAVGNGMPMKKPSGAMYIVVRIIFMLRFNVIIKLMIIGVRKKYNMINMNEMIMIFFRFFILFDKRLPMLENKSIENIIVATE